MERGTERQRDGCRKGNSERGRERVRKKRGQGAGEGE